MILLRLKPFEALKSDWNMKLVKQKIKGQRRNSTSEADLSKVEEKLFLFKSCQIKK